MWENFANILRKLGEKSLLKIGCYVLLLAGENLRLKNSYILAKTWLSAPKITRPKKLQHYFPIIINIILYLGHENKQKTKNINFHWRTSGTCSAVRPQMPPLFFYNLYNSPCKNSHPECCKTTNFDRYYHAKDCEISVCASMKF